MKKDRSAADGYFESPVKLPNGETINVQGWNKTGPDGKPSITSHAPRFDKNWPKLPPDKY